MLTRWDISWLATRDRDTGRCQEGWPSVSWQREEKKTRGVVRKIFQKEEQKEMLLEGVGQPKEKSKQTVTSQALCEHRLFKRTAVRERRAAVGEA